MKKYTRTASLKKNDVQTARNETEAVAREIVLTQHDWRNVSALTSKDIDTSEHYDFYAWRIVNEKLKKTYIDVKSVKTNKTSYCINYSIYEFMKLLDSSVFNLYAFGCLSFSKDSLTLIDAKDMISFIELNNIPLLESNEDGGLPYFLVDICELDTTKKTILTPEFSIS